MALNSEYMTCEEANSYLVRTLASALSLLAMLQLSGCANAPKQAFNRAAHADIAVIGLLEPDTTGEYAVLNLGHPGMGFGLIGGLVAAADMQSKTNDFTRQMNGRDFDLRKECMAALASELRQAGYTAKIIAVKREKRGFLSTYDALDRDVDAYLDVSCSAGYVAAGPTAPYLPSVGADVRMIKRTTKEIVYQELFYYGYENRFLKAVSIFADPAYSFPDFLALTRDDARALEGLRNGIPLVVKRLVQDLGAGPNRAPLAVVPPASGSAAAGATEPNALPARIGQSTEVDKKDEPKAKQEVPTSLALASATGAVTAATVEAGAPGARRPGVWIADRFCAGFYGSTPLNDQFEVAVNGDEFFAEKGQRGQPDYLLLRGMRGADGRLVLKGHEIPAAGRVGGKRYNQNTRAVEFEGRLDGDRYQLKGKTGRSSCRLTMTRTNGS